GANRREGRPQRGLLSQQLQREAGAQKATWVASDRSPPCSQTQRDRNRCAGAEAATSHLRPLETRCDESPHCQDYYRADNCPDEASAFVSLIPPDRLPKVRCYKSSDNPEHGCPDETGGLILISRVNQFRDHACDKHNCDRP